MDVAVCPICLSIFATEYFPGDECPECGSGIELITWEEHLLRIGTSFADAFSQYRGQNEL
jgi:hypothetical protein